MDGGDAPKLYAWNECPLQVVLRQQKVQYFFLENLAYSNAKHEAQILIIMHQNQPHLS